MAEIDPDPFVYIEAETAERVREYFGAPEETEVTLVRRIVVWKNGEKTDRRVWRIKSNFTVARGIL